MSNYLSRILILLGSIFIFLTLSFNAHGSEADPIFSMEIKLVTKLGGHNNYNISSKFGHKSFIGKSIDNNNLEVELYPSLIEKDRVSISILISTQDKNNPKEIIGKANLETEFGYPVSILLDTSKETFGHIELEIIPRLEL
ncbi:MAG: hypothetical protein DRQ88_08105 [Epsilonproteobacteria bacterium]|nr:MAG: hypothetical protein DRQ89_09125 [Campylobacterota bacterium]RLA66015.1 MAG: hypothetical protein DRQ88_08105 [Campylobacterota bacterium]